MTKGIADTLGIKSLEEILAETENENEKDSEVSDIEEAPLPAVIPGSLMTVPQMKGTDHAKSMDEIADETLQVARRIVDMGFNIDPSKAPRMFEVANQYFKMAADAKISKRDAELKLMKLIQTQKKLELDEKRLHHEMGDKGDSIRGDIVMHEDRNTILKMLRAQKEQTDD